MTNYNISLFSTLADNAPKSIKIDELFNLIRKPNSIVLATIKRLRQTDPTDKKAIRSIKKRLPAVTVSCICEGGHEETNIVSRTMLMQADFDHLIYAPGGNEHDFNQFQENIQGDEYMLMGFVSPSGRGYKAIIPYSGDHLQAFEGLKAYFFDKYGVVMDETCKDLNRLMFLSFDQTCFYNKFAKVFVAPETPLVAPKPKVKPAAPTSCKWAEKGSVGDDIEKVIDQLQLHHTDITGGYKNWLKIGFGISSEFGERGRSYFHAISYYHPEYDYEATDKQYDECLKQRKGGGASIKTIFGIAKDHGIDIRPAYLPEKSTSHDGNGGGKSLNELKAAKVDILKGFEMNLLDELIERGSQPLPNEEGVTPKGISPKYLDAAKELVNEARNNIEQTEVLAEPQEGSLESLLKEIPDTTDSYEDFSQNGFFVLDSKLYTYDVKSGKYNEREISNFCMEYLYHFDDGSKNTKRLVKIQRNTGEISIFEMSDEEAKLDKFKQIIRGKACSFRGTSNQYELIFTALTNHEKKAKAILAIGYNSEFDLYAFSDALFYQNEIHRINEVGIIFIDHKTFYLPAHSKFNIDNTNYINERRTRYLPGILNFKEWSSLIYKAYSINGAIALCFVIQCLFRDIIFEKINFFPFMFLFGPPGTGKSSFIDMVLRLWGDKDPGVSVKSNFKAIARSASQRKNALLFLKEYDNNISADLENAFKNFYDGQGYSTAQTSNDNKTHTWLVESGIMIDGNCLPTKSPAFFDRNIVLHFEETRFSAASTKAHKQLTEASEAGFGAILIEILKHREVYKERIKAAFEFSYNELKGLSASFDGITIEAGDLIYKEVNISKMPERTIRHLAFILSGYIALKNHLDFPFSATDIYDKLLTEAIEKVEMMSEINDVAVFWDSLNYFHNIEPQKVGKGKQFETDPLLKIVYIKFKDLYPVYAEYCKRSNILPTDQNTVLRTLTSDNYPAFMANTQKGRGKAYTKANFGSCYRFQWTEEGDGHRYVNGKEITFINNRTAQTELPY